jgi:predicted component of type VI protein secretion system
MSIQQLRESVARDLEDLLNSRIAKFDRIWMNSIGKKIDFAVWNY